MSTRNVKRKTYEAWTECQYTVCLKLTDINLRDSSSNYNLGKSSTLKKLRLNYDVYSKHHSAAACKTQSPCLGRKAFFFQYLILSRVETRQHVRSYESLELDWEDRAKKWAPSPRSRAYLVCNNFCNIQLCKHNEIVRIWDYINSLWSSYQWW